MALNQQQRQNYLELMGITSYFPRFQLPGAKVSELAEWPENQQQQQQIVEDIEKQDNVANSGVEQSVEQATDINIAQFKAEPAAVENKVVSPEQQKSSPAAREPVIQAELRFQLSFVRINHQLCVINQIPYLGSAQSMMESHQALLGNILSTVNLKTEKIDYHGVRPFRWPFSESAHLDNSELAAQLALKGFLQHQHHVEAFSQLLIMGDLAASLVKNSHLGDELGLDFICVRSLDEMLNHWPFKKEAWQQIQHLPISKKSSD